MGAGLGLGWGPVNDWGPETEEGVGWGGGGGGQCVLSAMVQICAPQTYQRGFFPYLVPPPDPGLCARSV